MGLARGWLRVAVCVWIAWGVAGGAGGADVVRVTTGPGSGGSGTVGVSIGVCVDAGCVLPRAETTAEVGGGGASVGVLGTDVWAAGAVPPAVGWAHVDAVLGPAFPQWAVGGGMVAGVLGSGPLVPGVLVGGQVVGNVTFALGSVADAPRHVLVAVLPLAPVAPVAAMVCGSVLPTVAQADETVACSLVVPGNGSYGFEMFFAGRPTAAGYGEAVLRPAAGTPEWATGAVVASPAVAGGVGGAMASRMLAAGARERTHAAVHDHNAARLKALRGMVGVLYALVALVMTLVVLHVAVWQTWVFPLFLSAPVAWWFATLFVAFHGLSWMGGFGAWSFVLACLLLYSVIAPLVYCCVRMRAKRRLHTRVFPENGNAGSSDEGSSDEDEEEETSDSTSQSSRSSSRARVSNVSLRGSRASMARRTSGSETSSGVSDAGSDGGGGDDDDDDQVELATYTVRPAKLSRAQRVSLLALLMLIAVACSIGLTLFFVWEVKTYKIVDRLSGEAVVEYQPQLIAKSISLTYGFERMAKVLRYGFMLRAQSKACGVYFKQSLDDDAKFSRIEVAFIRKYKIDMSIFNRTSYLAFSSVNDWFTRALADGVRPLAGMGNDAAIASVADCRLTVFPSIRSDVSFWLKGEDFSVYRLLDQQLELSLDFAGGSMALFRLAPADYHRTHSPISGTITAQFKAKSTLFSVNADAMRSGSGAVYNDRVVTIIDSGVPGRKVAFVAIGATCVGTVTMKKGVGSTVAKGEDISDFQFGGSTVAVLFPRGSMVFDDDLLVATRYEVESYVLVRSRIGRWVV